MFLGANVHATTATGDTALTYACENGHTDVADVLLQAGADLVRLLLHLVEKILGFRLNAKACVLVEQKEDSKNWDSYMGVKRGRKTFEKPAYSAWSKKWKFLLTTDLLNEKF